MFEELIFENWQTIRLILLAIIAGVIGGAVIEVIRFIHAMIKGKPY